VVFAIARVLRGDSGEQGVKITHGASVAPATSAKPGTSATPGISGADEAPDVEASSLPPWGLLPSQIPPRVELLPGPSSLVLFRRARSIGTWIFGSYAAVVIGAFVVVRNPGAIALAAMVVVLVTGAVLSLVSPPYAERATQERAAGYTVWRNNHVWRPQVDDETGFVIRLAGAPALSKGEELAALERVREIARYLDER
jgi:hypothetical protein